MPQWLHDRAKHILAKNKGMPESEAFAIATQQSHALGKSPKSYGTVRGREEAKAKYKTPADDQKTAMSLEAVRALKRELLQRLAWHDELPGGLADKDMPGEFPQVTLREGQKIESEHTKNKHLQREIAMDHLKEDPKYYGKLKKMEKAGEEEFKLQGHTEHQGIPIAIENRKGSVRKGVDKDGKPWRTKMFHPYGYIKGSKGADGEEVDAYVGPHEEAAHAYVVHQRKSDGKGYDEDKVMLGFPSKEEAVKGYLKHYNSDKFLGPVKEVPVERLKEMLQMKKKLVKISSFNSFSEKLASVFLEQFIKEANLSDSEAAHFKELVKERSVHEQASRKGISPDLHEKMLHNAERLKHYQQKKRDPSYSIPSWVGDRSAKPPASSFKRPPGGSPDRAAHNAREQAAGRRPDPEPPRSSRYERPHGPADDFRRKWQEAADKARKKWEDRVAGKARDVARDAPHPPPIPKKRPAAAGALIGGAAGTAYSAYKSDNDPKSWAAKHPVGSTAVGAALGGAAGQAAKYIAKAAADELSKLGAITDEQAQRALDRYETLDRQRPTGGQVARYATLGAVAGPAAHVVGNLARGRGLKGAVDVAKDAAGNAMSHGKLRTLAGTSASGALTTGVVPFIRTHLDRSAERNTLKQYMGQSKEKDSAMTGSTPAKPWAANESVDLGKYGFATSQYSSGLGRPRFQQESAVPPFRAPSLRSTVPDPAEKLGMSATPRGTFASAKKVGLPRVTNVAGPSIASQVGHTGHVIPGAGKGGIGKGGVNIGSSASVM